MKKLTKVFTALILAISLVCSVAIFAGCSGSGDSDKQFADLEANQFGRQEGDITYILTWEENNDFSLKITKKFDGFTATKIYIGPIHNMNGDSASTMPVFFSMFTYDGEKAPSDAEAVHEKMMTVFKALPADGVDGRERYFTVDRTTHTFTVDEGHSYNNLDYTYGYWLASDFAD